MGSKRLAALAVVIVVALGASLTSAQAAQPQQARTDAALFDRELAQAQVDAINIAAERLRIDLDQLLGNIDGLTIDRDSIELNSEARNSQLQASRTQARRMAINAYIGIGPPLSGIVILDAESANESSFRSGILRHQAERLKQAADTYAVLAGEADATVLSLSDDINDQLRQAEALSRQLRIQLELLPDAEWVLSIAEIHEEADIIFERTRRAEPTAEQWRELRFCESTETYDIDTGNTFFGAYQFTWETWGTVGGSDNPAHAPPEEQDARARLLYADRGSQPWPICGRFLP